MDRIKPAYAIVAALWLTAGLSNAQGQTVDVAAAKKDAKVVVYGTVVPQAMEELHRTFEKKYDIKVEYWRGSSTAVAERDYTAREHVALPKHVLLPGLVNAHTHGAMSLMRGIVLSLTGLLVAGCIQLHSAAGCAKTTVCPPASATPISSIP